MVDVEEVKSEEGGKIMRSEEEVVRSKVDEVRSEE